MNLEEYLIEFCSPTLASLKVGSLFNYAYTTCEELIHQISHWNQVLSDKGLRLRLLRVRDGRALLYLYRISQLKQAFSTAPIQCFLREYGYERFDLDSALWHLQCRLQQQEGFPHEIGLFLGYPLEDVEGFIRCKGCRYKCSGIWKVYGDAEQAQKSFAAFAKCRSLFRQLWAHGRSVQQLTVAA